MKKEPMKRKRTECTTGLPFLILCRLYQQGESHSGELKGSLGLRTDSHLYNNISLLKQKGLILADKEGRKNRYSITPKGILLVERSILPREARNVMKLHRQNKLASRDGTLLSTLNVYNEAVASSIAESIVTYFTSKMGKTIFPEEVLAQVPDHVRECTHQAFDDFVSHHLN